MSATSMRTQRNQAVACMVLSLVISSAVFLSVFGSTDSLAIAGARRAAAVHEAILRDTSRALEQNQAALAAVQAALQAMRTSRPR
jgi:hypothetical protein